MATPADFPARGKVTAVSDGKIVFNPANTNYELHLLPAKSGDSGPAIGKLADLFVRASARKVYSVPSGGNFIAPIFGPPKIIQGRVRYIGDNTIVVQAGTPIIVSLPADDAAVDLNNGIIAINSLVNVVALPGATFETATVAMK